ncbi:MAG: nickel-dependent hydrogenase large subunit [Candidatus Atribacteria bacterium]|nr:nickel-dependent hydrogenase large subunit [Candidatus Atribacteria bacterium]
MKEKEDIIMTSNQEIVNLSKTNDYDMYFGPAHPGSGNFGVKIKLKGEKIISAYADPGYLHRGFEKLMEYRLPLQNAMLSDRICVLESLAWELVHAEAIEELMELEIPERAQFIRVIMAELSRIQSHMIWWGVFSIATGFDTGFKIAFGYRDYILDLFAEITGGRVYPAGYICPGGVRRDFPEGIAEKIDTVLSQTEELIKYVEVENPLFQARTKGIGVLTKEEAIQLGATGFMLRASGMKVDLRKDDPYEVYQKLDFDIPVRQEGDVYARLMIGVDEVKESVKIIRQAMQLLPEGDYILPAFKRPKLNMKIKEGEVYVHNEIARGEGGMHIISDGNIKPYRVKVRGPSFSHMIPVLENLLRGADIADIPAIYWSLNVCPADLDR